MVWTDVGFIVLLILLVLWYIYVIKYDIGPIAITAGLFAYIVAHQTLLYLEDW